MGCAAAAGGVGGMRWSGSVSVSQKAAQGLPQLLRKIPCKRVATYPAMGGTGMHVGNFEDWNRRDLQGNRRCCSSCVTIGSEESW